MHSLELDEIMQLVVANGIGTGTNFRCLTEIFREDGDLSTTNVSD